LAPTIAGAFYLRKSSGNFATLAAIRVASSLVSNFAASSALLSGNAIEKLSQSFFTSKFCCAL